MADSRTTVVKDATGGLEATEVGGGLVVVDPVDATAYALYGADADAYRAATSDRARREVLSGNAIRDHLTRQPLGQHRKRERLWSRR